MLNLLQPLQQRALRNMPAPFLPPDSTSPFGVRGLHSALDTWLISHRTEKASADQWYQRINNLSQKGLRADELTFCGLAHNLDRAAGPAMTGDAVSACLDFGALRLSILPVVRPACEQLTFVKVPAKAQVERIKPKLRANLVSRPQSWDRVLGYWIDIVEWNDLLGPMRGYMAITHRGQPIVGHGKPLGLCATPEQAQSLANHHAAKAFPKMSTMGNWSHIRLTGGEHYREWLLTLPSYPLSYFSSHFEHRNVLLHVRCDIREGADGERVLVLQEVQSDWAQQARRDVQDGESSVPIPVPPWLQEWPALALKLMLLHAAQHGATALAWTPGTIQVKRYAGLGKAGLTELYDRTLPAEATRLLRPYGKKCESIEVFQPTNFYIEPADIGYEVRDEEQTFFGTAATWEEAQAMLPDGAHEALQPMHGVALDEPFRQALLANGFYAWGSGIK